LEDITIIELVLNNFEQINKDEYSGDITFGQYVDFIKSGIINVPKDKNASDTAKSIAIGYNNDENKNSVEGFQVYLHANSNQESSLFFNKNNLTINSDSLVVLDGVIRTLAITELAERFMNNLLSVRINYCSINKAKEIVMNVNTQKKHINRL